MSKSHYSAKVLLALVVSISACSNPLSVEDASGVYGWSGQVEYSLNDTTTLRILSDTVILSADYSANGRVSVQEITPGNPDPSAVVLTYDGTYKLRRKGVALLPAPPECEAICAAVLRPQVYIEFRLSGNALRMIDGMQLVYTRQ